LRRGKKKTLEEKWTKGEKIEKNSAEKKKGLLFFIVQQGGKGGWRKGKDRLNEGKRRKRFNAITMDGEGKESEDVVRRKFRSTYQLLSGRERK